MPAAGALHVTHGDSTASTLREGGVVPRIVVWRDVLHEGPVPAVGDDELRGVRARFLAGDDAAAVGWFAAGALPDRIAFEGHRAALADWQRQRAGS